MLSVVRQAIEHLVGVELAAVLGPPYARGGARVGYRHGSKVRTITSPVGAVTVTLPRGHPQAEGGGATEWQSQVVPAYARRMRQVNEVVLQAYVCGRMRGGPWRLEAAAAGPGLVEERHQPGRPGGEGLA